MQGETPKQRALRDRIRELAAEVSALNNAIREELDLSAKTHSDDAADEDDAV